MRTRATELHYDYERDSHDTNTQVVVGQTNVLAERAPAEAVHKRTA